MPQQFPRRAFLAGALAVGTASAVATYYVPGGSQPSDVTLRFVTGADTTGARDLLIRMWNEANPATRVESIPAGESTADQRATMVAEAEGGTAAVLNLDIIDLPFFQGRSLIETIELERREQFLEKPIHACALGRTESDAPLWAAPFNADVGVLFQRGPQERSAAQALDPGNAGQAASYVAQLDPLTSAVGEAFTVNVLEQALSRDPYTLGDGSGFVQGPDRPGFPVTALESWQQTLEPLRSAVGTGRFVRTGSEDESRDRYAGSQIPYMRNWPVKYRELKKKQDVDALSGRMTVGALPRGILGGQCLAIVANSRLKSRAVDFVRFLVSEDAQRILASYGLPAAHSAGYSDELKTFIPHLDELRGAIEEAALRPIHWNYREFSQAFYTYVKPFLNEGRPLPTQFVEKMQGALR